MKKIYIFLLLISAFTLNAEFNVNQWYFGYYAGLDFNGDTPRPLSDGLIYQW